MALLWGPWRGVYVNNRQESEVRSWERAGSELGGGEAEKKYSSALDTGDR